MSNNRINASLSQEPISRSPVSNQVPNTGRPVTGAPAEGADECVFSFKYWCQIEYFGIGDVSNSWMASVLERLKVLSGTRVESLFLDAGTMSGHRFHKVNWGQRNCPVTLADIPTLGSDITDEPQFDLYQFQVSQALGRVMGFFQRNVFHIVLCDPAHNMQPSKKFSYKVSNTRFAECEITKLKAQIQSVARELYRINNNCAVAAKLRSIDSQYVYSNALTHYIDDADMEALNSLIESGACKNVEEVLKMGLELYQG